MKKKVTISFKKLTIGRLSGLNGCQRVNTSFLPPPKIENSPSLLTNLRTYRTEDLHNRTQQ